MAKSMGHEGTLTSGVVMLTTVFSAFTLTGWLVHFKKYEFGMNKNGFLISETSYPLLFGNLKLVSYSIKLSV
mgnify:CR=1 FL=1